MTADGFGISETREYYEMQFDSLDTSITPDSRARPTDWPLFYLGRPLTNVAAIKVLEVQIPFSFYVVNSMNNTFLLTIASVCTNAVVTLPVGNYNTTSIGAALKTALDTALLSQGFAGAGRFTVAFSGPSSVPNTGKFTFVFSSGISAPMTFTFGQANDSGNFNPRLLLGFDAGANTATYVVGTGMVLTAPNANLVSGPNYLYLNSRKLGSVCNLYLPAGASNLGYGTTGPQMAKIPVNVQSGGIIYWQDPDPSKWFDLENMVNFTDVDFYLTLGNASNQIPLQLNGLSFSIKMGVLVNKTVMNTMLGGSAQNSRVFTRFNVR